MIPTGLTNSPEDIERNGVISHDGRIVARIGVILSIYFMDGFLYEKKKSLFRILEEYIDLFGDKLTHFHKPDLKNYSVWDRKGLPEFYIKTLVEDERQPYYFKMKFINRSEIEDPGLIFIMATSKGSIDKVTPLSGLKVHFPPTWLYSNLDAYLKLIINWCNYLSPVHGSGGLGDLTNPGDEITEPWHYHLLKQYPGLEYDPMGSFFSRSSTGGYERPRSSNWLTILGAQNEKVLGGYDKIKSEVVQGMSILPYNEGSIIVAAEMPTLGDAANGGVPKGYHIASQIVRPIRYEDYRFGLIKTPAGFNGRDETLKWLRRFD